MKHLHLLFLVFLFLFISGCTDSVRQYSQVYGEGLDRTPKGVFDYNQFQSCTPGQCYCFTCTNSSSSFYSDFTSLKGGICKVETNCNQSNFNALKEQSGDGEFDVITEGGKGWTVRQFMIGQGATFADFGPANQQCGDRLDMTVRWLYAKSFGERMKSYPMPIKERGECFLKIGVIPVYLLYSEGKNVNITGAEQIALEFGGAEPAGPVIFTTEVDFDSSNDDILHNVSEQIIKMKDACPNCLIAVAPRMNDQDGLKRLYDTYPDALPKTDLVAYGINTRYSKVDCRTSESAVDDIYTNEALNFSRHVRDVYHKPTLVTYMLFEEDPIDLAKSCWTEYNVYNATNPEGNAHTKFFGTYLIPFLQSGVMGVAPYRYNNTVEDPLRCPTCRLGASQDRLRSWFGWCQSHKITASQLPEEVAPTGDLLLRYANSSSAYCEETTNYELYSQIKFTDKDFLRPETPELGSPLTNPDTGKQIRVTCEPCANQNGTEFPFDVGSRVGGAQPSWCSRYESEISSSADPLDVDAMMVRAIIWTESSGLEVDENYADLNAGKCAISQVAYNQDCYDKGYDLVDDPDAVCPAAPRQIDISDEDSRPQKRYCAFGLMQTIDSPYPYWKEGDPFWDNNDADLDRAMPDVGMQNTRRGREIRDLAFDCAGTDGKFNPFNPSHNICNGVSKFRLYLDEGLDFAENHAAELNATTDDELDTNKVNFLGYYFALLKYNGRYSKYGGPTSWMTQFNAQKTMTPEDCTAQDDPASRYICSGVDGDLAGDLNGPGLVSSSCRDIMGTGDFIKFTRVCVFNQNRNPGTDPPAPDIDYGSDVFRRYLTLVGTKDRPGVCRDAACGQGVVQEIGN